MARYPNDLDGEVKKSFEETRAETVEGPMTPEQAMVLLALREQQARRTRALVALGLLSAGSILSIVAVSLLWSYEWGLLLAGCILLATGLMIGTTRPSKPTQANTAGVNNGIPRRSV